jgi:hypothetical protein
MHKSVFCVSLLAIGAWLHAASPAAAQRPTGNLRVADRTTRGTVSPYLNLGYNANGLSNYATLVRPLLNQREALEQQADDAQPARRPARTPNLRQAAAQRGATGAAPARERPRPFLNYSHYFGTAQ